MTGEEAAPLFDAIESVFGKRWLEKAGLVHRLAETWARRDFLASMELACFGASVQEMLRVDRGWVRKTARNIRNATGGTEHGFIFEVLVCGMLAAGGMEIRPTQQSTPGHDAQIRFTDGYTLRLSFKNHDISMFETQFRKRAAKLREALHKRAQEGVPLRFVVDGRVYLEQQDFDLLTDTLRKMRVNQLAYLGDRATAYLLRIDADPGDLPFAPDRASEHILVFCQQHDREQKRFERDLRKACSNMGAHCLRAENAANIVLMRLHPSADMTSLSMVAERLLQEPTAPVDAILLYQPAIARDSQRESRLVHHMIFHRGRRYVPDGHTLNFAPLMGASTDRPTRLRLEGTRGEVLDLENRYVYQAGDLFRLLRVGPGGEGRGALVSMATGLREHLLMERDGSVVEFRGLFPEHDELRLL